MLPGLFKAVLVMQYSPIDQFEVHHCVTNTHTLTFRPNRFVIAYIIDKAPLVLAVLLSIQRCGLVVLHLKNRSKSGHCVWP